MTREEAIAILENSEYELSNQVGSKYCRKKYEAVNMAIKSLSQEPCSDAVSRQAVLDIIEDRIKNGLAQNVAISQYYHTEVKKLPPVNPQKWIPVSEKLPEKAFGCLVTVEEDDWHGEPQRVLYPDFVGYDGETWNNAEGEPISFDVIAWMPLPEPYKAESEDKE